MKHYVFAGGTAIVTGAASGIGEALAHGLAARGSRLVLLDRDADRLDGVASAIRERYPPVEVDTVVVNLDDHEATARVGRQLAASHPETTLLINNAGVAMGGRFDQLTLEEFWWVVDINFRAVVTLTHHLLPVLRSHPGSHLVNLSSIFGRAKPLTAPASSRFAASPRRCGPNSPRTTWASPASIPAGSPLVSRPPRGRAPASPSRTRPADGPLPTGC